MYQPKYTITDSLLMVITELEQNRTKLELANFPTNTFKDLMKKSKAVNMFHLAHMIGVELTIKDAEKAIEGKKISTNDARGTILNNFRNVMEFVRSDVTEAHLETDINLILHLNKILLTNWKEIWDARLRTDSNEIEPIVDGWLQMRDKNVSMGEVEARSSELLFWFKTNHGRIHPLIRIAVLIFEMIRIAPLKYLNQLTIISLVDLLLYKNGYLNQTFLPVVREIDLHNKTNMNVWANIIESGDLTKWIEQFIADMNNSIKEDKEKILGLMSSDKNSSSKQPFLDLNRRQLKILRYLQTIPTVKREDYVQMMDVSAMTAFRDLNDLLEKKLLRVEGNGRGTKYLLANR